MTIEIAHRRIYIYNEFRMNLSVTYYIFSWTIFDNRKELPRAFWVPNSQQDIWALFELIFCLPIQTNRFQRRFFVFYVCFVTSIGVQIPNTNYQMFLSNSKRNPASEANSSYFKLEANKLVICFWYLVWCNQKDCMNSFLPYGYMKT